MQYFDVIVLGGGPAGSVVGRNLAEVGHRVLILEADRFEKPRVGETLSPNFHEVLPALGMDVAEMNKNHRPAYAFGSAWNTDQITFSNHIENINGQGWHVNRALFDKSLFEKAKSQGAVCYHSCRVSQVSPTDSGWQVSFTAEDGQQQVQSRFLVNACGRSNLFSKRFGDEDVVYDDLAAVGLIGTAHQFNPEAALIESAKEGWWYTSPLPEGRAVVLLMTDLALIKSGKLNEESTWLELAAKAPNTALRVAGLEYDMPIFVRPAHSHRISAVNRPNYIPVGDALVSFDPLNGAGLMRAIQTALGASRAINRYLGGQQQAITQFVDSLEPLYEEYLENRASFYAMETRWPEAPFWADRVGELVE